MVLGIEKYPCWVLVCAMHTVIVVYIFFALKTFIKSFYFMLPVWSIYTLTQLWHFNSYMPHDRFLLSVWIRGQKWSGIVYTVQLLATGWEVRGSKPGSWNIFHTCPDHLWGPHHGFFRGEKAAGAWRWPTTPYSAEVKIGVKLGLCPLSGLSCPVLWWTVHFYLLFVIWGC
jgi:hypothetical protein